MVVQTPILRNANGTTNPYRGLAGSQMVILKDYMKLAGLNVYSRHVKLNNGVVIKCDVNFNKEDIHIYVPIDETVYTEVIEIEIMVPMFMCCPRKFGVNDGYGDGLKETGFGEETYPLRDYHNTTMTIGHGPFLLEDGETEYEYTLLEETRDETDVTGYRDKQLYGNIDWIGWDTSNDGEISNAPILTWKGPLGRTIGYDYSEFINGFSLEDIVFSPLSPPYYTCFSPNIYANGSIYTTGPSRIEDDGTSLTIDIDTKVLGAALTSVENGSHLVCVVNNHYEQLIGFYEEVWINRGDPALYDSIDHPNGWVLLHSKKVGRPSYCWFFNKSGTKATQGIQEYVLDTENDTATQVTYDSGGGSHSFTVNNEISESVQETGTSFSKPSRTLTIKHSGSYPYYSDYKDDRRVQAVLSVDDDTETYLGIDSFTEKADLDTYIPGDEPETTDGYVDGGFSAYVGAQFSVEGRNQPCGRESAEWSFSGGTISSGGTILSVTSCGMGTVSVTYADTPNPASLTVRLNGHWEEISSNTAYVGSVYQYDHNCDASAWFSYAGTDLSLNYSDCDGYVTGSTYAWTLTEESVSLKTYTMCASFVEESGSSCSFGCSGVGVVKVPASGGADCSPYLPYRVTVYEWQCP